MAKSKEEYTCKATFTEGCEKRLTEALVDIYYQRKLIEQVESKEEKTA